MKCRVCQNEHAGSCASFFASQSASEKKAERPAKRDAINTARQREPAINAVAINKVVDVRTPNGRSRDAYNEYMRGYMARYRAARRVSGGAA